MDYPLTADSSEEITTLYEISGQLTHATTPGEWLEAVSIYARKRGAKVGYLLWMLPNTHDAPEQAEIAASWRLDDRLTLAEGTRITLPALWKDSRYWENDPQQPALIGDARGNQLYDPFLDSHRPHEPLHGMALLPQVVNGRWISLLVFYWRDAVTFDERDQRIFKASMQLLGPIVETMQLARRDRHRAYRAEQINTINMTLSQARDEQEILSAITKYALQNGAYGTVLMYMHCDEAGNPVQVTYIAKEGHTSPRAVPGASRPLRPAETQLLIPDNQPIHQPLYFEDHASDERFDAAYREALLVDGLAATVILPLRNARTWQALICAYWAESHNFSEDERIVYRAIIPTASSVVARRRVYLETEASEKAATTLYRLAESINASTTYQELLDAVGNLLPDCDGVYLNLCQNQDCEAAEYFEVVAGANVPEQYQSLIGQRIFMSAFPMSETASQDKLVVIEDTHDDPRVDNISRTSWDALRTRAALGVQFYRGERRFGWLFFNYAQPRHFTEHDRRLGAGIGDLVMAAVERIHLLQEADAAVEAQRQALLAEQEAREDLSLLYQASEAVNAAMTFSEVIKALAPLAHQIEKVHLILWEHLDYRKASYFELVAGVDHWGERPAAVGRRHLEADFPIANHMAKLRQLAIENILDHPLVDEVTRKSWQRDNVYALLMVSLVQDERWYGVLSFESTAPRRYSERDRRLTLAISDLVLSAVVRIQAQHELAQAAEAQRSALLSEQELREEMALLYQVSKHVNQASTLNDVGEAFLQLFERPLHATIWAWDQYDRSRAAFVQVLATTDPQLPIGTRLNAADVPEAATQEPGQLITVDDVDDPQWADDATTEAAARQHGIRSYTFTNLMQGERVLGIFTTGSWVQHTYTPREKRLIAAVIDLTAAALERFRLRTATEQARHRAEILANLHAELSRAKDETGILTPIADAAFRLGAYFVSLNYATSEEGDSNLVSDVVVTWEEGKLVNYQQLGKQPRRLNSYGIAELWMPYPNQVFYMEDVYTDPRLSEANREGILRDFRTRALVILPLFSGGAFQGLVSISWDQIRVFSEEERYIFEQLLQTFPSVIATRRALLAEQSIRQETAQLYQVSKAINRATDLAEVLSAVKRLFPAPVEIAISAWEHYDRSQATYLECIVTTDSHIQPGSRIPLEVLAGPAMLDPNQLLVINDIHGPEWADNPVADSARMFNLYSVAYANLMHGQRVQGLFAIASYEPYHFSPQEIRLMSAIAELTGAALERFRARQAEEEARQEREELFQASQAINAASSFQEILQAVSHIAFDDGDFYLYIFENFDFRRASYIETVATGESRFMQEGMRISFDQLPFLRKNALQGLTAYEDIPNHPDLDAMTKATLLKQGTFSNLRFGLSRHDRLLGAFGIDHATPRRYSEREKRMMIALGELISAAVERIRLQQETQAAKEKAERLAAQAQQLAALEERTRLARELHDSVSQALYGIGLGAQTAQRSLEKDPALARESVEYVLALAEAGLAEMRALIFELRPESLENEGLVVALTKQCASLRARHGIVVELDLCDEPPLALAAKESLYRVAREALHNIVKHANASQIYLRMCCDDDVLRLEVIDNGVGFETAQDFPGHLGLQSMYERVTQLGGTLDIASVQKQGTSLTVVMPLKQEI